MAAERPQSFFRRGVEKFAELSQKFDVAIFLLGGGVILLGYPGVGWVIIFGNAVTYVGAEAAKRWARKGKRTK